MVLTAPLAPRVATAPRSSSSATPTQRRCTRWSKLTEPGPFAARTHELGGYVGIREPDDGRLLAMAGRRTSVPGFTEISAVCTHPDARRRGYGEVVTSAVAQRLLDEGITPFLHVAADATTTPGACTSGLGFTTRRMAHFVGVRPGPPPAPRTD